MNDVGHGIDVHTCFRARDRSNVKGRRGEQDANKVYSRKTVVPMGQSEPVHASLSPGRWDTIPTSVAARKVPSNTMLLLSFMSESSTVDTSSETVTKLNLEAWP